jgi:16S rRNA (cytosine967-C5)-methyltransferase
VLVDAPCSATGTMRRHPDVGWLKTPAEIPPLTRLQEGLLAAALDMVRPGGIVVYCACSLQPEEGPAVGERVLASGPDVERLPISPDEIGGWAEMVTASGDLRTLPCHLAREGGVDGFYAIRLRRR